MTEVVNFIVQLLIADYGNGSNKIILPGSIKPGSREYILQLTICLLCWHVFRSSLLRTENSMLLLLISKRRLILLIEICYGLFC